jgi:hypothetical protein
LELPVDFVVPAHRKIQSAANLGRPFILAASRWWQPGKGMLPLVNDIDDLRAAGDRSAAALPSLSKESTPTRSSASQPAMPAPSARDAVTRVSATRDAATRDAATRDAATRASTEIDYGEDS